MPPLAILVAAEEAAGLQALKLVAGGPHRVVAVLTSGAASARGSTVAAEAARLGMQLLPAERVTDPALALQMKRDSVDLLLNVHSLHRVHADVLAAARIGAFNLHPGPLPEYAGLSTPSWALYNGERSHAATVHRMVPEVDAGPIAYEHRFELGPHDTGLSVSAAAVRHGLPLIERLLEAAVTDPEEIPAVAQDASRHRWYPRRGPHGGRLPWRLPATRIVAFVRASDYSPLPSPWGSPLTRCSAGELQVLRARLTGEACQAPAGSVAAARDDGVRVAAADEWVALERVRVAGRIIPPASILSPGERLDPGPQAFLESADPR